MKSTVRIFSKNIALEFGKDKYAHITMKVGKFVSVGKIEFSFEEVISELESDKANKYLCILKDNYIMLTQKKDKIQKEVRQLTSSKFTGANTIRVLKSQAVCLARCSAVILK